MYVYRDDYEDFEPNPECAECGGPGIALGTLGYLLHLRCRDCGMDFSVDSPDSYEEA
jgi:tRNA(Ile2) C34 agmatinyltransferase TiaS